MKKLINYTKEEMKEEIKKLENLENCFCDLSVALDFLNNNGNVKSYKEALYEARSMARRKQHYLEEIMEEDNNVVVIEIEAISYKELTL